MAKDNRGSVPLLSYESRMRRWRIARPWIWLMGLGVFVLLAVAVQFQNIQCNHCGSSRLKCASNLRQIGLAILQYSNDHGGQFPDSMGTIMLNEELTFDVLTCPSTNDTPATGATTREAADDLQKPGHLSYVYVGANLKSQTVKPDQVLAYEPLSNHANVGMNVLFGDFHVEFIALDAAKKLLAKIPPTIPINPPIP